MWHPALYLPEKRHPANPQPIVRAHMKTALGEYVTVKRVSYHGKGVTVLQSVITVKPVKTQMNA